MIKVVEIRFDCEDEFDARREVHLAIASHLVQIYKKAKAVHDYTVECLPMEIVEKRACADLAISMDELTESLNRYRIEGKMT